LDRALASVAVRRRVDGRHAPDPQEAIEAPLLAQDGADSGLGPIDQSRAQVLDGHGGRSVAFESTTASRGSDLPALRRNPAGGLPEPRAQANVPLDGPGPRRPS